MANFNLVVASRQVRRETAMFPFEVSFRVQSQVLVALQSATVSCIRALWYLRLFWSSFRVSCHAFFLRIIIRPPDLTSAFLPEASARLQQSKNHRFGFLCHRVSALSKWCVKMGQQSKQAARVFCLHRHITHA